MSLSLVALALIVSGTTGTTNPVPGSLPLVGEWRLEGGQAGAHLGSALATADVNGDGFGDLVVGAPGHDDQYQDEGRVQLFLGSAAGLSVPSWVRYGRQRNAHFGARIANAGDVNGDGFDDIVISSPDFDRPPLPRDPLFVGALDPHERIPGDEGRIQLFLGSPTGLGAANRTIFGIERGEHLGAAIDGAGDVNGDGFDDVVAGATGKSGGRGALFLFDGSASGMGAFPSWIKIGTQVGTGHGSAVAAAGDQNADGFADFASSEPTAQPCGRLSFHLGSASGPGPNPTSFNGRAVLGRGANIDLVGGQEYFYAEAGSCATGVVNRLGLRRNLTIQTLFETYSPVAAVTLADVDGDGRPDMIEGVPAFENGPMHGRVFVHVSGAPPIPVFPPRENFLVYDGDQAGAGFGSVLAAIDVDGDGSDELFIAAPEQASGEADEGVVTLFPGWTPDLALVASGTELDEVALATGDFDGDGFHDVVSSVFFGLPLRVRHGSPTGLPAAHDGTLSLPPLPFFNGITFGASTGDVNGDGLDDVQITFVSSAGGCHGGYVLDPVQHAIYFGTPSGLDTTPVAPIEGGVEAELVGDVDGDGFDDLLHIRPEGDRLYRGSALGIAGGPFQTLPVASTHFSDDQNIFGSGHHAVLSGDVDGDPYADLVIARRDGQNDLVLELYVGSPSGLVLEEALEADAMLGISVYWEASLVGFRDMDFDGVDDLLVVADGSPKLLHVAPEGFTRAPQWWEHGPAPAAWFFLPVPAAVGDFDADGIDDLLFGGPSVEGHRLHLGSLDGFSRTPAWFGLMDGAWPFFQRAGDYDGDGRQSVLSWYLTALGFVD